MHLTISNFVYNRGISAVQQLLRPLLQHRERLQFRVHYWRCWDAWIRDRG